MSHTEVTSLIRLLDDPDEHVFGQVKEKLLSMGDHVIPALEDAWESHNLGLLFQNRIEELIHDIQYRNVYEDLSTWKNRGGNNLLEAVIHVSRYHYPDLDEKAIHDFIDKVQQDTWLELNNNLTGIEKIRVLNHLFFEVHGMVGNTQDYHSPTNSYINSVVESRRGNPISLSILYMTIAQALNMPVYGVNLPKHFILAYMDDDPLSINLGERRKNALFYINPFGNGAMFGKQDIEKFLRQLNLKNQPSFFEPCTNVAIVRRVINNLVYSYQKLKEEDKVRELRFLSQALR